MPYSSSSLANVHIDVISQLQTTLLHYLPAIIAFVVMIVIAFAVVMAARGWVRRWLFGAKRDDVKKAWQEVEEQSKIDDDTHLRMAIIKADAVLDMALRAKGFPGKVMNDRLNFAIHKYGNLRRVRSAHGLRNVLAHEPMKPLSRRDGLNAIGLYRSALKELGAL